MTPGQVPAHLVRAGADAAPIPDLLESGGLRDALAVVLPLYADMIAEYVETQPPPAGQDGCNCPCSRARTRRDAALIRRYAQ